MNLDFTKFKTLAFDLDGTLAASKQPMSTRIGGLLGKLAKFHQISIVSGADWPQFQKQVLPVLREDEFFRFKMYPTCGAKQYRYRLLDKFNQQSNSWFEWHEITGGANLFDDAAAAKITALIQKAVQEWPHKPTGQIWGPQIENRGTQITFSALGQEAPPEEKSGWDADFEKRSLLKGILEYLFAAEWGTSPYQVKMGGATSLDITKVGIDKRFAVESISLNNECGTEEILFIGDALGPGGNDWPATQTGCCCIQTDGPEQTEQILERILVAT